jgi:outer membrane protein assembly factor BamB
LFEKTFHQAIGIIGLDSQFECAIIEAAFVIVADGAPTSNTQYPMHPHSKVQWMFDVGCRMLDASYRRVLGVLFFATIVAQFSIAGDWPQFRGPTGQGIAEAKNVPLHWSSTSNVVWKTAIPGEGWSSPVLFAGNLYLTSATSEGGQTVLHALCVSAKNGKILWDTPVLKPEADRTRAMHQKNTLASPTPIVRDGKIYVHFGHMGMAKLDLKGKVLWTQTDLKYPPLHGNGSSPALIDDLLVFSCDGMTNPFVAALDAATGKLRWRTPRISDVKRKFSFSTPLAIKVDGATQVISPGSGYVAAYDPKDGHEIWRVNYGEGYSVVPRPVFAHSMLFVTSGFERPVLYAIRPAGATGDVTEKNVVWTYSKGVPHTPSLLVIGNELYMVSDSGIGTCLDARTGEVHWNERLGGDFSASPVFADGRIYFQNEGGVTYIVRPGKTFDLLAQNELGERTLASPAVTDNALFLRSKLHLWRIGN